MASSITGIVLHNFIRRGLIECHPFQLRPPTASAQEIPRSHFYVRRSGTNYFRERIVKGLDIELAEDHWSAKSTRRESMLRSRQPNTATHLLLVIGASTTLFSRTSGRPGLKHVSGWLGRSEEDHPTFVCPPIEIGSLDPGEEKELPLEVPLDVVHGDESVSLSVKWSDATGYGHIERSNLNVRLNY